MARSKVDYGIDLGTTNSSISRMEKGEPVIKKTDQLKDTMPSCVYVNKKRAIQVGDTAYNSMKADKLRAMKNFDVSKVNSFIEFKRTMGTDKKYYCSNLEREFSSEELSAEVLKTLKSFVTDETFNSVVITVPAKFTVNQKDATNKAAKLAGFQHCELLQEPIAASMAYGLDSKSKDGYWLVFDFGGGTFDAALIKVEDGIMKVTDSEGDNFLGGKNLDYAIVDEIIIPYLEENNAIDSILKDDIKKKVLQDAMKFYAEETKIQMSFNDTHNVLSDLGDIPGEDDEGEEFELDINVTQEMMERTLGPIFQKSIDICLELIKRNNLEGASLDSLILVGGPTHSPILRKMLEQQIKKTDVSVDPLTVVSKGAALFASTVDISEELIEAQRDKTKIQLELGYESTTVEEEEFVTVKILKEKTEGEIPEKVFIEVERSDKAWSSGKVEIDENGDVVEVKLVHNKPNAFKVKTYNEQGDLLPCQPDEFTIIQGSKIPSATLPYHIGIEIQRISSGKMIFYPVKGLEKNQSLPCIGTANDLKILKQIKPGIKEDFIKIPIYQGDHGAEGSRAIHNEHVYDVIITGEDIPALLPEGSTLDITMKVDRSEVISFSAFFPSLDFTFDVNVESKQQQEVDEEYLETEINKAKQTLNLIKQEGNYADQEELERLDSEILETEKRFQQGKGDYDRKKDVLNSLRKSLKKLESVEELSEWPKTESVLKEVFYRLEKTNKQFGNEKTNLIVEQFRGQIQEVIKEKNVKVAKELIDNMRALDYSLESEGLGVKQEIGYLQAFKREFDTLDWTDRNKARMILDRGLQMAVNNPKKEELRPVIIELYKLLPRATEPPFGGESGGVGK